MQSDKGVLWQLSVSGQRLRWTSEHNILHNGGRSSILRWDKDCQRTKLRDQLHLELTIYPPSPLWGTWMGRLLCDPVFIKGWLCQAAQFGVELNLVRVSIGLEDTAALTATFEKALQALEQHSEWRGTFGQTRARFPANTCWKPLPLVF
jgi:hypothetical protein